jgi:hypothetical protein
MVLPPPTRWQSPFLDVYVGSSLPRFVQLRMHKWARNQMADPLNHQAAPDFAMVFDEIDEQRWMPPALPPKYLQQFQAAATLVPPGTPIVPTPQAAPAVASSPAAGIFKVKAELLDLERVPLQRYFASKRHMDAHGSTLLNCPRLQDHYRHTPEESLRLAAYLALANPVPVPSPPAV